MLPRDPAPPHRLQCTNGDRLPWHPSALQNPSASEVTRVTAHISVAAVYGAAVWLRANIAGAQSHCRANGWQRRLVHR